MRKCAAVLAALILALALCSCGGNSAAGSDSFAVNIVCQSENVYQIFYSCYIDGEYFGMGGMADLDGNKLSADSELQLVFTKAYFEGLEDPSGFSLTLSPYGENDTSEIGTSNCVYIYAQYGESYTVVFSGDAESGFTAALQ